MSVLGSYISVSNVLRLLLVASVKNRHVNILNQSKNIAIAEGPL